MRIENMANHADERFRSKGNRSVGLALASTLGLMSLMGCSSSQNVAGSENSLESNATTSLSPDVATAGGVDRRSPLQAESEAQCGGQATSSSDLEMLAEVLENSPWNASVDTVLLPLDALTTTVGTVSDVTVVRQVPHNIVPPSDGSGEYTNEIAGNKAFWSGLLVGVTWSDSRSAEFPLAVISGGSEALAVADSVLETNFQPLVGACVVVSGLAGSTPNPTPGQKGAELLAVSASPDDAPVPLSPPVRQILVDADVQTTEELS